MTLTSIDGVGNGGGAELIDSRLELLQGFLLWELEYLQWRDVPLALLPDIRGSEGSGHGSRAQCQSPLCPLVPPDSHEKQRRPR